MKPLYRKHLLLLLICTLFAATVIGCSQSNGNEGQASKGSEPPASASASSSNGEAQATETSKYDPPITITTVRNINSSMMFKNGEDIDNNVHYRWTKDTLGIEIKNLWSATETNDGYATKLRLALSSNQEMPDLLIASSTLAHELIASGKFQEVGPLWDKYASQTWKDAMNEDPAVWYEWTTDGKRMGIPILDYAHNNDRLPWVNGAWMKKLNLEPPTTLDEFEKVMDAFVNQDPDGNGKKDTYALAASLKGDFNTWMADLGWVFGAYGVLPNQWNKAADGSLAYGSVQPEAKQGLAKIKEWLDKGYINKESGVWDGAKAAESVAAGRTGIIVGPSWTDIWPLGDFKKNNPGASLDVFKIPVGPEGKAMRAGSIPTNGVILINKDMKNPEAFFTYMNYLYDHAANPAPGSEFEYGWAKGYDWDMVDGQPTAAADKIPGGSVIVFFYTLTGNGARIPSLNYDSIYKFATTGKAETAYEKYLAGATPPEELKAVATILDQKEINYASAFTGAPTPTMQDKWEYLGKLEQETFSKIIYGKEPLDYFDTFVQKWNEAGGAQITNEVNEWYASATAK